MLDFQPTPNPNAVKVICPRPLVDGSLVVTKAEDAPDNALALELLALEGVTDLFFLNNFVTVSKDAAVGWEDLAPSVEEVVLRHLGAQ